MFLEHVFNDSAPRTPLKSVKNLILSTKNTCSRFRDQSFSSTKKMTPKMRPTTSQNVSKSTARNHRALGIAHPLGCLLNTSLGCFLGIGAILEHTVRSSWGASLGQTLHLGHLPGIPVEHRPQVSFLQQECFPEAPLFLGHLPGLPFQHLPRVLLLVQELRAGPFSLKQGIFRGC